MTPRRRRLRISDIVSILLNPSALTGAFYCLLAAHSEPAGPLRALHTILGVTFTAAVPVGLIFLLKAKGRLSDMEMRIRSERSLDYWLCAAGYSIGAGLLWITEAPWPLWGLVALHVPNTLVLIICNRKLKVSIHTMVLTSLAAAALILLGREWAPAALLVPLAAWARWDAGSHTIGELLGGILIGGSLTSVEIIALRAAFGG